MSQEGTRNCTIQLHLSLPWTSQQNIHSQFSLCESVLNEHCVQSIDGGYIVVSSFKYSIVYNGQYSNCLYSWIILICWRQSRLDLWNSEMWNTYTSECWMFLNSDRRWLSSFALFLYTFSTDPAEDTYKAFAKPQDSNHITGSKARVFFLKINDTGGNRVFDITLCKKASNHHANLPLEMYSFTL